MIRTLFLALCSVAFFAPATPAQEGHAIPGVSFQVFLNQKQGEEETIRQDVANEAVATVVNRGQGVRHPGPSGTARNTNGSIRPSRTTSCKTS